KVTAEVEAARGQRASSLRPQFEAFAAASVLTRPPVVSCHLLTQAMEAKRKRVATPPEQRESAAEAASRLVDRCRGQLARLLFFLCAEKHQAAGGGLPGTPCWGQFLSYVAAEILAPDAVSYGRRKLHMPRDLEKRPNWNDRRRDCTTHVLELLTT